MAIEVIESELTYSDEMIQRFPEYGTGEIKWGSQLTVTDGEWGVFFRDGKVRFQPLQNLKPYFFSVR